MKPQHKIELIFLLVLTVILYCTSFVSPIDKVGFMWPTYHLAYNSLLILIVIAFGNFNHFVLRLKLLPNLFYTLGVSLVLWIIAHHINNAFISFLRKLDNPITPLGWEFNYRWLDLLVVALLLVVVTETIGLQLPKRKKG